MIAARLLAIAPAVASLLACTELDALHGSRPPLPWSPVAPRWRPSPRADGSPPYHFETVVVGGALELATDLPRATADCLADHRPALCADDDQDGLVDEWEDLVLHCFRPFVRIDEGDPLHVDGDGRVGSVGRVVTARDDDRDELHIRVFLVLGYSRDYGRCTFGAHLGDSERVALDLIPVSGTRGAVRLVGAYTASHENSENDTSRLFEEDLAGRLEYADDPLIGQPRWVVYASRSKHATYATTGLCEAIGNELFCTDEDCAGGRSTAPSNELLLPVANAGEPFAPMVPAAEQMFDEPVWDDVDFCGGLGYLDGVCASPLRDKLLFDPFSQGAPLWGPAD